MGPDLEPRVFVCPVLRVSLNELYPCLNAIFHTLLYMRVAEDNHTCNSSNAQLMNTGDDGAFGIRFLKMDYPMVQTLIDSKIRSLFAKLRLVYHELHSAALSGPRSTLPSTYKGSRISPEVNNNRSYAMSSHGDSARDPTDDIALQGNRIMHLPVCAEIAFLTPQTRTTPWARLAGLSDDVVVFEQWVVPILVRVSRQQLGTPPLASPYSNASSVASRSYRSGTDQYRRIPPEAPWCPKTGIRGHLGGTSSVPCSTPDSGTSPSPSRYDANAAAVAPNLAEVLQFLVTTAGTQCAHLPLPPSDYPFFCFNITFQTSAEMPPARVACFSDDATACTRFPVSAVQSEGRQDRKPLLGTAAASLRASIGSVWRSLPEVLDNPLVRNITYLI